MHPKVSVIIPCYGVEKYLDCCMETIVGQSLQDIEIILVDDKSPDHVPQMCDNWAKKDPRIKVIHKEVNEGLGLARNSGLEIATGEYVAFVDSDDFLDITMYQKLYKKAKEGDADAVYCNCYFYKDELHQYVRKDVKKETVFNDREQVDQFLLDIIGPEPENPKLVKYMMSVWHAIFRRSLFVNCNIKFVSERKYISEDAFFDIDMLHQCSKVVYLADALYYYRDNNNSLSRKFDITRYKRNKYFLEELENKLATVFPRDVFYYHFLRQVYHRLFSSVRQAVIHPTDDLNVRYVLKDKFWQPLFKDYPWIKMSVRHKLFFYCLKNKCCWWIFKLIFRR